jgi:hypothetical protein
MRGREEERKQTTMETPEKQRPLGKCSVVNSVTLQWIFVCTHLAQKRDHGMLGCSQSSEGEAIHTTQHPRLSVWNGNLTRHPIFPRVYRSIQRSTESRGQTFTKRLQLNTLGWLMVVEQTWLTGGSKPHPSSLCSVQYGQTFNVKQIPPITHADKSADAPSRVSSGLGTIGSIIEGETNAQKSLIRWTVPRDTKSRSLILQRYNLLLRQCPLSVQPQSRWEVLRIPQNVYFPQHFQDYCRYMMSHPVAIPLVLESLWHQVNRCVHRNITKKKR